MPRRYLDFEISHTKTYFSKRIEGQINEVQERSEKKKIEACLYFELWRWKHFSDWNQIITLQTELQQLQQPEAAA